MKKTYLLLLTLFVSIVALAEPVTPDEARQKITKVMSPRRSSAVLQDLRLVATSHYQEQEDVTAPSFYVFNVGEGQGYIIAGADDRIPAVLGYSDQGSFDPNNMPVNMQAWLEGYNHQMEYLNQHPEAAAPRKTVSGGAISPLIQTKWDQGAPYNNLCPMDGDKRSLTGCVATAMAQIMYFWKYPNYTVAEIPGYTTTSKGLTVSAVVAGTSIDWDNMLLKYNGSETADQQQAVAHLMLLCGTAVQMDYSSTFSGAWGKSLATGLLTYFDYDAATAFESRSGYRTAAWNQKVYDELKAGRPVYYEGESSGSGHAFVIDGYGGDDYFHVNWGWGGASDAYFLLSILDPNNNSGYGASSSADGYSFGQGAVFGAQPNTGVLPTVTPILTTQSVALPEGTEFTRTDASENFVFKVGFSQYNGMNSTYTFDWGVGLFDTNDQLLMYPNYYYSELDPGWGFWNAEDVPFIIQFGSGVTNGTYIVKPISRERGSKQWLASKGSDIWFVTAIINDNTLTLIPPTFGLTGSIEATGKKEVGSPLAVNVSITNNGTLFNDQIYLLVNGELVGGRHFDLDAGQTDIVGFSIVPKTVGDNELSVCTRFWNGDTQQYDYPPFITGSVTIEAGVVATLKMTPKTKNAVNEGGQTVVKEDKAIVSIDVTNIGSTDYDNDAIVKIYKYVSDNNGSLHGVYRQRFQLAAGASTNVEVELDNIEDGARYFYYVYYMSSGEEVRGYQYSKSFYVHKSGEEPEVEKFTVQSIDVQGTMKTNDEVEMTINIKNEGNVKTGMLYVFINDVKTGDIVVDITPGETRDYKVKYLPTTAGEYTVKITTDEAGQVLAGEAAAATKTFVVADPEIVKFTVQAIDVQGTMKTNDEVEMTINIKNEGNVKTGMLYVFINDVKTGDIVVDITPGETRDYKVKYLPTTAGEYTVKITTDEAGQVLAGEAAAATKTFVVADPEIVKFTVQAIDVQGTMKTNDEVEMTINIKNEGNVQTGMLYVFINDVKTGDIVVDITPGETRDYKVKYLPTTAGEYTVKITTDEAGQVLAGEAVAATKTFVVADPEIVKFTVQAIDVQGTMKTNDEVEMTINIKNEGNVKTGMLYVFINDVKTGDIVVDITPGETRDYKVKYLPTTAGEYTVKITTDEAGQVLAGEAAAATKTFVVADPEIVKFTVQAIDVQGTMKTNDEVEMTINIKNEGNVQTGLLYVFINDVKTGDIVVDITPGETKDYKVKYLPTTAGEYTVKITTDEAGQVLAGEAVAATKTFVVADPEIEKFTVQAIHVEGTMKPGEELNMTINVKNEGNVQTGKLYLFVNNEKTSEIDLDITPGETKIYEVKYTPTTEGDLIVKVTSDEAGENLAGDGAVASQTITITGIELLVREMGGGPVSVYALNGNKMAESQGEELSAVLKSLPKGVYIIRVGKNSKTIYN